MRLLGSRQASWVPTLLFLFLPFFPDRIHSQDTDRVTVKLTILDAVSGNAIQGVLALVEDLGWELTTDSAGVLIFSEISLGSHQLTLRREGYETESGRLTVDKGGEMTIRMRPTEGPSASEMSRITGTVRDRAGGGGLEGVSINFPGLNLGRTTDRQGQFQFENVPPGEHSLTVQLIGYSSREDLVHVEAGTIVTLDLALSVEPIELEPIEVSVERRSLDLELSGFYTRRLETSGVFITQEKIEERAPLYTSDLFRGMAGVKVLSTGQAGRQYAVTLTGSRSLSFNTSGKPCFPAVWLDGQMVHPGTASGITGEPAWLDNLVHPEEIAGIEVYNSQASMPVQYNLFGACGVIVIWTRHGR